MKKTGISSLKIAAIYIGTVVGAGFATGQEILHFFLKYGYPGLVGLLISTLLFILAGYVIMEEGSQLNAQSYREIILYSAGKVLGTAIDWIMTFFLFGAFAVMIAGTGAVFRQQLYLPELVGCLVMAGLTAVTVLSGFKSVMNSISMVVPFLLISVLVISVLSISKMPPRIMEYQGALKGGISGNWLVASILYVSYNTILSIAVLGPLGAEAKNKRTIKNGAILGSLGLGAASFMIFLALAGIPISALPEVPMIFVAGNISSGIQFIFALVLIAEIYTTAVGSLYGFVSRFTAIESGKNRTVFILGTSAVALLLSRLGFSNLVKYLYPLVGYGGFIFLICLFYSRFKRRNRS